MTIETAIRLALDNADETNSKGLLIPMDLVDDINTIDDSNGDPETIYSIASLYSDDEDSTDEWEDKIFRALEAVYPEYI